MADYLTIDAIVQLLQKNSLYEAADVKELRRLIFTLPKKDLDALFRLDNFDYPKTLLIVAIQNANFKGIELLLEAGAKPG